MTNWLSWLKSVLFTGQGFPSAKQFGIDLGQFFQSLPQVLIGGDALPAVPLLVRGLEQELQDLAWCQTAGQIVEGTVLLSVSTDAIGLAAGGETLDVGCAQEMRRNSQLAHERGFALAQGQGRSAA